MRRTKVRPLLIATCAIAAAVCCVLGLLALGRSAPFCAVGFPRNPRPASVLRPEMHLRWSTGCLYAEPNFGDLRLVSSSGAVAVLGTYGPVPFSRLIVLNAQDGDVLWQSSLASATEVAADDQGFFIGGLWGTVERRSPLTGEVLWRTSVAAPRRILALHVFGPWVYAYANPDQFHLLDKESGKIIDPPAIQLLHVVHLILPDLAIGDSVRAEDLGTHVMRWNNHQELEVLETPIITGDVLVVKAGEQEGRIAALDIKTGEQLWQSERDVVSNIVLFAHRILFLDRRGALHEVEPATGLDSILLRYDGGEFVLPSDLRGTVGGYYLAADFAASTIHILLGDSGQLDTFTLGAEP